jgi:nucleoside-diphosphate-sugar epimerase
MNKLAADLDLIAANTRGLWDELRGQHLFITGGTGFFGCWLLESFCHVNRVHGLDAHATVLTRNPDAFARKCPHLAGDSAVKLLQGDVRSFRFPNEEYKYVIHAATEASARQAAESPLEMLSTIVAGTERVLEFAATHGTRKLLLTSSGAVYGKQPSDMTHVPETYAGAPDPLDRANVYGEGKRTAELICALYRNKHGLECKIARCWAFCGPHLPLDQHFAIGNFIGDVLAGRAIHIKGDGTPRRSYLYAADLAVWLWSILLRGPAMVPINVGSSADVSILELAQIVAKTLNPKTEVQVAKEAVAGVPPLRYVPCVDRARELLDLRETVDLEEGIRRTANWYAQLLSSAPFEGQSIFNPRSS